MRLLRSAAVIVLLLAALPATAFAQDGLRVTYDVDRSHPEQTVVTGTVFNDGRVEVLDVSVTAEALDARGKVVARGITYCSPRIVGKGSAPFTAKVPVVASATRFRASVSAYRRGFAGGESP